MKRLPKSLSLLAVLALALPLTSLARAELEPGLERVLDRFAARELDSDQAAALETLRQRGFLPRLVEAMRVVERKRLPSGTARELPPAPAPAMVNELYARIRSQATDQVRATAEKVLQREGGEFRLELERYEHLYPVKGQLGGYRVETRVAYLAYRKGQEPRRFTMFPRIKVSREEAEALLYGPPQGWELQMLLTGAAR